MQAALQTAQTVSGSDDEGMACVSWLEERMRHRVADPQFEAGVIAVAGGLVARNQLSGRTIRRRIREGQRAYTAAQIQAWRERHRQS